MVSQKYLREGLQFTLSHFVEECGKALAAAGKTQRWGLDSVNPEIPVAERETNRDWLLRELDDVEGCIIRLRIAISEQAA